MSFKDNCDCNVVQTSFECFLMFFVCFFNLGSYVLFRTFNEFQNLAVELARALEHMALAVELTPAFAVAFYVALKFIRHYRN